MAKKKAVVLLSGGLDSATCLYWAKQRGLGLYTLAVHYGQRHAKELASAKRLAKKAGAKHYELKVALPWLASSSLVDKKKRLPRIPLAKIGTGGIPTTYVPGRNTIFTALGLSLADAVGASLVVVGANALDYSGYPDCRPAFYKAFDSVARQGTQRGAEGQGLKIATPLVRWNKARIVREALRLKVPLSLTWSCYAGGRRPCGTCDSCKLRAKGFSQAGCEDPAL
jgi:7-cyano-7-deazaguanine synthase